MFESLIPYVGCYPERLARRVYFGSLDVLIQGSRQIPPPITLASFRQELFGHVAVVLVLQFNKVCTSGFGSCSRVYVCVRVSYNHGEVYIELRVNFRVVLVGEWRQAKVIEFFGIKVVATNITLVPKFDGRLYVVRCGVDIDVVIVVVENAVNEINTRPEI